MLGIFIDMNKPHICQIWVPGQPWAPPGMPDSSMLILLFCFAEPSFAVQKANEMKNWPHLEVVAVIEKSITFLKST